MQNGQNELLNEVALYYSEKLAEHGETPRGVDWNGEQSQVLRFEQLSRIIVDNRNYSINDLGCGYGALFDALKGSQHLDSYLGIDVSNDMIASARQRYSEQPKARFLHAAEPDRVADFGVASGIFNVRLGRTDAEWFEYLQSTLDILNRSSRSGFAFNCLTSYSDEDKKRDYLYYADPCQLFDLCKRRYSRQVALLHDYGLYEFTLLVRK
ncbi:class I SAM-dependent methyltransferase [Pseudomonas sp. LF19]|uniref:class I SAM-dependent methyltransferase n=1 Tax=Pseudomonas sp. LF19 TaxID=2899115 RepID=UPI000F9F82EE|nr:class I SAM-dependent methyltransferase [Pseudomonas sp. LF19]MCE5982936.1 class I SAM-dependent methyltransferase [Pseudomonas sp. LF19]